MFSEAGTFDGQDGNSSDPLRITPEGLVKDGQQGGEGEAAVDQIMEKKTTHRKWFIETELSPLKVLLAKCQRMARALQGMVCNSSWDSRG